MTESPLQQLLTRRVVPRWAMALAADIVACGVMALTVRIIIMLTHLGPTCGVGTWWLVLFLAVEIIGVIVFFVRWTKRLFGPHNPPHKGGS